MKRFIAGLCGELAGQVFSEMLDELRWPTIVKTDEWYRRRDAHRKRWEAENGGAQTGATPQIRIFLKGGAA